MKVLTFIRLGNYQTCNYVFDEESCHTHLFVFALSKFYKEELNKLIVFLTKESRQAKHPTDESTYFQQLEKLNSENNLVMPQAVTIKSIGKLAEWRSI